MDNSSGIRFSETPGIFQAQFRAKSGACCKRISRFAERKTTRNWMQ